MTSEIQDDPKPAAVGVASLETPVAEPVRGPAPATAVEAPASSAQTLVDRALDWWPAVAFLASAAMLATAHAFETFGKLAPCLMCLKQREVYWTASTVALVALAVRWTPWAGKLKRPFDLLLAAIFLYGAGLAAFHAGVEWKWWPGPAACAGGASAGASDIVAMLKGGKVKTPSCDEAAWVFLGLSMAGWNALVSLGLAVASAFAGLRKTAR